MSFFGLTEVSIVGGILIFARIAGFFAIAPFFGSRIVPTQIRVALSVVLAAALAPLADITSIEAVSVYALVFMVVGEFILGLGMGFVVQLLFAAIQAAGQFIDLMIGFAFANIIDPLSSLSVSVLGQLYNLVALLVFFAVGGHLLLVQGLAGTLQIVPLGQGAFSSELIGQLTRHFGDIFFIGMQVAAPVIIAMVITDIFFGVMARAMPRMNIFFVGFPFKIAIGLIFVGLSMSLVVPFISDRFIESVEDMGRLTAAYMRPT